MKTLPNFTERPLSSRKAYSGGIISVEHHAVCQHDGRKAKRDVVRHPGAAVILPLLDEENLLMEWQFRYPVGRHLWEIPAGKLEADETPLATAKRELLEETGYRAKRWKKLFSVHSAVGFCDERLDFFLAKDLAYVGGKGEEGEHIAVRSLPIERALRWLRQGKISDAKTIIALLWLASFRQ